MMLKAMKTIFTAAAVLAGIGLLAAGPAAAQSADFEPPRLSNGNPDLNGIWQALNAAHYDVEPHIARPAMQLRQGPRSPLPDVPVLRLGAVGAVPGSMGVIEGGGRIPYTAEARARKEENQANWIDRDPEIKCYMPGVPARHLHALPVPDLPEREQRLHRLRVRRRRARHLPGGRRPAETDSWMGQSVGRWEGDTLVVEVTGQNDQTWFDRAGSHHTNQLRVVERYTLIGAEPHPVRSDDGRPQRLHRALDHPHAALPADRAGRAADGLQVRRVRRGAASSAISAGIRCAPRTRWEFRGRRNF